MSGVCRLSGLSPDSPTSWPSFSDTAWGPENVRTVLCSPAFSALGRSADQLAHFAAEICYSVGAAYLTDVPSVRVEAVACLY